MGVDFQDRTRGGVEYKHSTGCLADLSIDQLRIVIDQLNLLSEHTGCVVFGEDDSPLDIAIFAGNLERFYMLSVARHLSCRVFYFQDTMSWWYGGSKLLPEIEGVASFLNEQGDGRPLLSFGQSSGGYAALAVGAFIPHSDVLACSPQTFPDRVIKTSLRIPPSMQMQHTPDHLHDMQDLYSCSKRSGLAAAVFGASEYTNPVESHFWLDHLHLAHLTQISPIEIFIAASANHSIVSQRAGVFADGLKNLSDQYNESKETRLAVIETLVHQL